VKVDHHISELLFDHDCVIVPSFGGFLASYQHATLHPTQHVVSPPSKKIAFNIFLKQNDGLLANHIAGREKLSYTDALKQIDFFVNQCQQELSDGKRIILDKVGLLYFDSEKNLQFEPFKNMNYLREAFGLGAIQYLPVKRDHSKTKAEKQLKEIMTPRPSMRPERKQEVLRKTSTNKTLRTIVVASAFLWLSFNLYMIAPRHFNLSSLNPFSSKNNTEVSQKSVEQSANQQAIISPVPVETTDAATTVPVEQNENIAMNATEENAQPVLAVHEAASEPAGKKYFIIGGAFELRENADAFVKALHAEGFQEAQILDTMKHLKMVCFNGFSTRSEAVAGLDRFKASNKNGWIYAR